MEKLKKAEDYGCEIIAPIPFRVMKYCGLWRSCNLQKPALKTAYNVYTCFMLFVLVTMALLVLLAVYQSRSDLGKNAENFFMMLALCNANFKAINILLFRNHFLKLLDILRQPRWSEPRNPEESEIQLKYSRTTRKISVYFTSAVFIAIILRVIAPILDTSEEILLPLDAYRPCNAEKSGCYWLLYWHQAIGTGVATLVHAAKDCLISAFLLQICSQLEILKHRLVSLTDNTQRTRKKTSKESNKIERALITNCIQDHQSIFDFADILNSSLSVLLFGQIAVTLPNLCLSIYLLSNQSIASVEFMMTTQFFSAVVIELFFFCWYGNEVTLNSLDIESVVSEMDWTSLSIDSRKYLLMIMVRASKPILFSVGPIMNMNIDSFLSIMKTSYSAFSVLQSTG